MTPRLLLSAALVAALPATVSAHGIGVEAKLKGDRVHVEAFFDDDTAAADAKVAVFADDGTPLADGKTDAAGRWSFPAPAAGRYRVTVDAGAGHLAKTTIAVPPRTSATAAESEVVVSEGPTRTETTEGRWLKAGVGLAVIGLLTWVVRRMSRWKARRRATGNAS